MERTPHQDKIIKRYYDNRDEIMIQKLSELVTDLYLAEGKKRTQVWKRIVAALENIKCPPEKIEQLVHSDNPTLLLRYIEQRK